MRPSSWLSQVVKVFTGNMREMRFPNISIPSHIACYIPALTIIIFLAIKAIGFSKVWQNFSNIFAGHYRDIKG